ncbi:MAG: WbqC family protein [Muribaculaceae bacterium]|nr:WbqC family protein [Muribaculaceae bacterium]
MTANERHPLQRYPSGSAVLLPPQLWGSVAFYATAAMYPAALIDTRMRFDKRLKSAHRYAIADTRGRLDLTVPVSHPAADAPRDWEHTLVSPHGRWWEVHRTALESAYGRTPFFEFYIDRLAPLFSEDVCGRSVGALVTAADGTIRAILGLAPAAQTVSESALTNHALTATDMPAGDTIAQIHDLRRCDFTALPCPRRYWQVRGDVLGFIDRLSILDLIFNLGPEAPLYLCADSHHEFSATPRPTEKKSLPLSPHELG